MIHANEDPLCYRKSIRNIFSYSYFLNSRKKESNKEDQDKSRGRNRRFDKTIINLFTYFRIL
jgi:hypothetical protein